MTTLEHTNGVERARGRAVPPLPEHTFKDSGITVRLRKIGPMTQQRMAQQIQKERPRPAPPIVKTELGEEANAADPAYEQALKGWERECGLELNSRLMRLAALECEVAIGDDEQQTIARTRRYLRAVGIPFEDDAELTPEENDRVCYILHVACASPEDLREFGQAVTERSVPTEEAVQRHIATFPGDVPPS